MCLHRGHWSLFAEGAKAADDVLQDVFGLRSPELRESRKDGRSFLTRAGFEAALRDITRELILIAKPHDQRSLQRCLQALDTNWKGLSPEQRDQAIDRAAAALGGVPQVVLGPVVQALSRMGQQVVVGVKRAHAYDLPINAAFDVVDQKVIDHAAQSQALFVRNEYGKREVAASQRAREIVSAGLESGLDRHDIGKRLAPAMSLLSVNRAPSYWENVASIHGARSRTWGSLSAFTEAGITEYEIVETMDEVTCSSCRLMHHRVFSTASAASRYQQVAESDDPEAVADFQPFLGIARNKETGEEAVYFKRGGQRRAVAQVVESGFGQVDKPGKYANVMGRGGMEAAGISAPPFHGRCRGTLVASEKGLTQVPVQVTSPAPMPVEPAAPARVAYSGSDPRVVTALDKLYADGTDETVKFDAGHLRRAGKVPQPYADAMSALGPFADLVSANGEAHVLAFNSSWSSVIATTKTVDRAAVANAVIAEPADKPIVIRHGGKDYLHSGAESLMARTLKGLNKKYDVTLVDLDKLARPSAPDLTTLALPADGSKPSPREQKQVRETVRQLLQSYGIASRDDRRLDMPGRLPEPGPEPHKYAVLPDSRLPGADATHSWQGQVNMRETTHASLIRALGFMSRGGSFTLADVDAVRVLIHEELHGASKATSRAYADQAGRGLEEAGTEILARKLSREAFGQTDPKGDWWGLPTKRVSGIYQGGHWCYSDQIAGLFKAVDDATGSRNIHERIEQALIATRKWDNGKWYTSSQDAVEDFVGALGVSDATKRQKLVSDLLDNASGAFSGSTSGPFARPKKVVK